MQRTHLALNYLFVQFVFTAEYINGIILLMKVDEKTARHLADLSNISLSDGELKAMAGDLEKIIGYIGELGQLDTTGVEPTYQVTGLENVWREDEIEEQIPREDLLKLAPEQANNSIKVLKVL